MKCTDPELVYGPTGILKYNATELKMNYKCDWIYDYEVHSTTSVTECTTLKLNYEHNEVYNSDLMYKIKLGA